jgi:hypothetical protein
MGVLHLLHYVCNYVNANPLHNVCMAWLIFCCCMSSPKHGPAGNVDQLLLLLLLLLHLATFLPAGNFPGV